MTSLPGISQTVAERETILRCEAGSSVFGLSLDGSADRDELGVCIEPPEFVVGLRHFEQWVGRTQPDGVRSGPGDLDVTIYSLRKWASLALKGNPTVLLLLFVPEERCTVWTPAASRLQRMAWAFASKRAGAAFLGYMQQQRQRLQGERGQKNVTRPELEAAHGFDTKYAGHILRLGFQGIEYLTTGRISVPTPEADREYVLACRRVWDDTVGRSYVYAYRLAGVLYALDHWLSLPWRCRLTGHAPERREHYNLDAHAVEEAWLECSRCGHWFGHLPEGVHSPRAGISPNKTVRS